MNTKMLGVKQIKKCLCFRAVKGFPVQPSKNFCVSSSQNVRLNFEEFSSKKVRSDLAPIVIAHGMLGSLSNWWALMYLSGPVFFKQSYPS